MINRKTISACDLQNTYPIAAGQTESFQKNGHILLREAATAEEIAYFRPVIAKTCRVHNPGTRELADRAKWLGNLEPGQPAASDLNPVLN